MGDNVQFPGLPEQRNYGKYLTFSNNEEGHQQGHGVARVDVVAAVDVLSVDAEAHPGEELEHPPRDLDEGDVVELGRALVVRVGLGQDRDEEGDGAVEVVDAAHEEDAPENHEPRREHQ